MCPLARPRDLVAELAAGERQEHAFEARFLDDEFPQRLLAALRGAAPPPDRAQAPALEPVRATTAAENAVSSDATRPFDAWLAALIAILFLLERLVATHVRAESPA